MAASPDASVVPDWPRLVALSLKNHGVWHTHAKLLEARAAYPRDLAVRGYLEIVRNSIVSELVANPRGLQVVPRLSAEFLTAFEKFNLSAQEGYLVALIDGRLDLQKLTVLSPFDPFTTYFIVAKLENERAIIVPR